MIQFRTYYLAKILMKLRIPSFKFCNVDRSANIAYDSSLTKVKVGRYSYIGAYSRIVDAEIGSFCSIGRDVDIGGGIHPLATVSSSPVFLAGRNPVRRNFASIPYQYSIKVKIGNDVWIGDYAYVKAGVTICDGAVVGAHSVVTHDVEPYSIVAGNPAKEIRKRFEAHVIEQLLRLKWWDWSDQKLKHYAHLFDDPEKLVQVVDN